MGFNFREAARNLTFTHREHETGGTKFPTRHTLHVRDADQNDQAIGHVDYFPPKRRGGPVHIDNVQAHDAPGAGSALINEVQRRHPDSTIKFLHERKRDQNTPSSRDRGHGDPTDWDAWHPLVDRVGIHRGFAMRVEPHHAETLNDPAKSKSEHLQALHEAIPEGKRLGMHWTTDPGLAKSFAHGGVMDPRTDIPVVLHAKAPDRKTIETRPEHLFRNGVFPYDHHSNEREVPIRRGRQVEVTGISWKPDVEHPDADPHGWVHHDYDEGESKHHTARLAAITEEDDDALGTGGRDRDVDSSAGPEQAEEVVGDETPASCSYCGSTAFTNLTDNGRVRQATCAACGGTMSAHEGAQWTPELIGDPSNHPKMNADPASGGVGGAANAVDPLVRDQSRMASRYERTSPTGWHYDTSISGRTKVTSPSGETTEHYNDLMGNGIKQHRHPEDMPVPLYHGMNRPLEGEQIEPGRPGNFVRRMKHVYMTEDPNVARNYAGPKGTVYQVQPTGWYGHRSDARGADWASEHPLNIVREVPHHEAPGYDSETGKLKHGVLQLFAAAEHDEAVRNLGLPLLHPDDTHDERTEKLRQHYEHLSQSYDDDSDYEDGYHPLSDHHAGHGVPRFNHATHIDTSPDVRAPIAAHLSRRISGSHEDWPPSIDIEGDADHHLMRKGALAYFDADNRRIAVSHRLAREEERPGTAREDHDVSPGWFSGSGDESKLGHTLTHEYGHFRDSKLHHQPGGAQRRDALFHELADHIPGASPHPGGGAHEKWIKENREHIINHVGTYAASDQHELIAELYAEHHHSPSPSSAAKLVGNYLDGAKDDDRGAHAREAVAVAEGTARQGANSGNPGGYREGAATAGFSRPGVTAAVIPSATCGTCKGKGTVSWIDEDPEWQGDPDENPGKVHTDTCDDCDGKGVTPETSDEELAAARRDAEERARRSTAEHVRTKHPVGKLVTIDDVRGCGPRCPVGHEWDKRRQPFHYTGKLTDPEMHEVLARFGHNHRTGQQHPHREHTLTPVKHAGFKGYVEGYEGEHEDHLENDRAAYGSRHPDGGFDEDLWDHVAPSMTTHEREHYDEWGEHPNQEDYDDRHAAAYEKAKQERDAAVKPVAHHGGVFHMLANEMERNYPAWHTKGEIKDVDLSKHDVYATQPHVVDRHVNRYLKNPGDMVAHVKQHGMDLAQEMYPGTHHPMMIKHEGNLFTVEGHHRTASALLRKEPVRANVYDADKHGFPHYEPDEYGDEHGTAYDKHEGLQKHAMLMGADCDFDIDDPREANLHAIRHHDDGVCTLTEAARHREAQRNSKEAAVDGPDWCTWRQAGQCTFPNDRNNTLLAIPQVRGACPWHTRYAQQICPISEPGPMALMQHKGSKALSWDEIGDRHPEVYGDSEIHGDAADGAGVVSVKRRPKKEAAMGHMAMPSRKHPVPEGIQADDDDLDPYEYENEQTHPGWDHRTLYARFPHDSAPAGFINYSRTPEGHSHPAVAIHMIKTYDDHKGKGVAAYLMDHLREQHPNHMFDHGAKSPSGKGFWNSYDDPGDPKLNLDHPDNAHLKDTYRPTEEARWRAEKDLSYMGTLSVPQSHEMARVARQDPEMAFHVTAAWSDVRNKAKRIRAEGKVMIKAATNEGLAGMVEGDHGTYENMITYRPGSRKIADWSCNCKWGEWAWDRIRFHGRQCSHSLALQYEAQSRGMFGREVHLGALKFGSVEELDELPGATDRPIQLIAASLVEQDEDPADIMKVLMAYGLPHSGALELIKRSSWDDDEKHEHDEDCYEYGCSHEGEEPRQDWDHILDGVHEIHRGVGVLLHPSIHRIVHDESRPVHERAHLLLREIAKGDPETRGRMRDKSIGTHWTTEKGVAEDFAERHNSGEVASGKNQTKMIHQKNHMWGTDEEGTPEGQPATAVVIHAKPDVSSVDHNPDPMVHGSGDIYDHDAHGEREVPYHPGASVEVKGISWKPVHEYNDHEYTRHDFHEPQFHHALLQAIAEEGEHRRKCPFCGGGLSEKAIEAHKCPHCGHPLGHIGAAIETEEEKKRKRHHRSNDTRRHAPNFGYGVPGWIPLPIGWCPQCEGNGCGHCGGTGQVAEDGYGHTANPVPDQNGDEGPMMQGGISDTSSLRTAKDSGPSVSGVALKAADTGRVLMLQRGLGEDHPAAGKWEFPGGHHEDGDTTSLHAGIREWEEEVGQQFPEGGTVHHTWTSPDGVYQGHVVVIPSEKDLSMKDGRVIPNPDDPKGDGHEQAAWWDIDHAKGNKVLRDEVRAHTPWNEIAKAGEQKTAALHGVEYREGKTWKGNTNVTAHLPSGERIGELAWHPEKKHITWVAVYDDEHRRQGVASGMLAKAREIDPEVHHNDLNDPEAFTEAGRAWAQHTGSGSSWDALSGEDDTPGFPYAAPLHSNSQNPGSTGFATSEDPKSWSNQDDIPGHLLPESSYYGMLHDEPEPALPSTDGAVEDEVPETHSSIADTESSALPNQFTGSVQDVVAQFQMTAGAQGIMASAPATQGGDSMSFDYTAAARQYLAQDKGLQKSALKDFSFPEQQELINEGKREDVRARNFGNLQIEGTHYEALNRALGIDEEDPEALFT